MIHKIIIFLAAFFFMATSISHAKYQFEVTPALTIGELYDDNIYLEKTDKDVDWMTTISPSINYNFSAEKNNFLINYTPVLVRYKNEEHNNTVRHSGTFAFGQDLTKGIRLNLQNTLLRSEEPVEETEGIYDVRKTRKVYLRSSGSAHLKYTFGPENSLNLGYNYSLLENEDITLLDNMAYYPSAILTYWPGVNDGIELSYQGTLVEYSRGDEENVRDSISGDTGGLKYIRRFGTHTTAFIGYTYNTRYYGAIKSYDIHEGSGGLTHSFSEKTSLSLSGGYFQLKNGLSGDDNGYDYGLSFEKRFDHGSIRLGGSGGWREGYIEIEGKGFAKYWRANFGFDYQLMENLSNNADISYIHNNYYDDRVYGALNASYGLKWTFLRWFSLSLNYSFLKRNDNLDIYDYNVNRIRMNFTVSRPSRL